MNTLKLGLFCVPETGQIKFLLNIFLKHVNKGHDVIAVNEHGSIAFGGQNLFI